jgi:ubiquinone/menaquinone biosynthesis C-methylase UbiE
MVVQPVIRRLNIPNPAPTERLLRPATPDTPVSNDLFERTAPLYAFMREHLFRDDTDRIATSLWPNDDPIPGTVLLEIGCGPGVYARRLAARHPGIHTLGVDRSEALVTRARARAASEGLANCRFQHGDALALNWPDGSVDAAIAARLFTVVDATRVIGEVHRVLRPGGNCFLAEPTSALGTLLPFVLLRLAVWLLGKRTDPGGGGRLDRVPHRLSRSAFVAAVQSHAWSDCTIFSQDGYQYAVCQKSAGSPT